VIEPEKLDRVGLSHASRARCILHDERRRSGNVLADMAGQHSAFRIRALSRWKADDNAHSLAL
jgi:hypothetical protein